MTTGKALQQLYREIRAHSLALAAPLSDADATVQSMEDASPAKWHLAHTSWFFETFLLRDNRPGYQAFDDSYAYLFNSYYEAEGARHARPKRGMLTRPSLDEIRAYRAHVDNAMEQAIPDFSEKLLELVELGLHHEQQHQELLLTDILHLFSCNPLRPAYRHTSRPSLHAVEPGSMNWNTGPDGIQEIGHDGQGFAFDCEGPRHQVLLTPFAIADRPITNGEWCAFIADGGYREPRHWLSDGWAWVQAEQIDAPLYWSPADNGGWNIFGLEGDQPLEPAAPVRHLSLYEADAYASWAGARLPTEAEWEAVAQTGDLPGTGEVWEWTGSAYRPYPGFRAAEGAVGEYNGKFMSGQFVLRGGSQATSPGHVRPSYRNFFYPHQRWQFTGLRLAKDL
nr:ergothioneine biosynthesis protein EgtB [Parasphingorhabdus marina]